MTKESSLKFAAVKNEISKDIGIFGFTLLSKFLPQSANECRLYVRGIQGRAKPFDSRKNISLCCQVLKWEGGGGDFAFSTSSYVTG